MSEKLREIREILDAPYFASCRDPYEIGWEHRNVLMRQIRAVLDRAASSAPPAAPPSENAQQPYVQPTSLILLAQLAAEIGCPSGDVNLHRLVGRIREEVIAEAAASRGDVGGQPVRWMLEYEAVESEDGFCIAVVPLYLAPTEPEVSNG